MLQKRSLECACRVPAVTEVMRLFEVLGRSRRLTQRLLLTLQSHSQHMHSRGEESRRRHLSK